jgi:myo-inositol 2-dehydrogenase / D-chiro-inositol 1-dehydrogenase
MPRADASVTQSQTVVDVYTKSIKQYPSQKVMCGFSRRFDASYQDAHAKTQSGLIGRPTIFRSQTCDKCDPSGFFISFAASSGGIFVDCSVHDIDLALWFLGEDSVVKSISAVGVSAVSPGLDAHNDRDNAVGFVEFWGGKIAYFYTCRMMAAGQEDSTEIIGTEGKLTVNMQPQMNLVSIYESTGIRKEIPQNYYDRFREALINEANEFVACCLDDKPLPLKLSGAVSAVNIAHALQESMISGRKIDFDEAGKRMVSNGAGATLNGH